MDLSFWTRFLRRNFPAQHGVLGWVVGWFGGNIPRKNHPQDIFSSPFFVGASRLVCTQSLLVYILMQSFQISPVHQTRCCDAYRFVYVYQMEIGTRGARRGTSFRGLNNNGKFLRSLLALTTMCGYYTYVCTICFHFVLATPRNFPIFFLAGEMRGRCAKLIIATNLMGCSNKRDSNFTVCQETLDKDGIK